MDWHSVKDGGQKIHLRWIEYIEFLTKALGKYPQKNAYSRASWSYYLDLKNEVEACITGPSNDDDNDDSWQKSKL